MRKENRIKFQVYLKTNKLKAKYLVIRKPNLHMKALRLLIFKSAKFKIARMKGSLIAQGIAPVGTFVLSISQQIQQDVQNVTVSSTKSLALKRKLKSLVDITHKKPLKTMKDMGSLIPSIKK